MGRVRQPISYKDENNHAQFLLDTAKQINGGLQRGTKVDVTINPSGIGPVNERGQWAKVTTPVAANTEFAVTHNLDYVPVGYNIERISAAASIYDGATPWTSTQIFLKCTASLVDLTLFIH
jgi:hypothetical protein